MSDDGSTEYWYNMRTGQVEHGFVSPSADRVGPFESYAEAERALEILRERSRKWSAEEAAED